MVHSVALRNDVLEVGTAKIILKTRSLNDALIRPQFETMKNAAPIYNYRMFGPRCHFQDTFLCRILCYTEIGKL